MTQLSLDPKGVRVPCPSCGATNRLAYGRLHDEARCSRCKAAVGPVAEPVAVPSAEAFDALVAACRLPILVDFWAEWCQPCRMVAPELEKVARARAGRALIVKVDTEAVPDLARRFGIGSIPTLAVFGGGRELTRSAGAMPAARIEALLDQAA